MDSKTYNQPRTIVFSYKKKEYDHEIIESELGTHEIFWQYKWSIIYVDFEEQVLFYERDSRGSEIRRLIEDKLHYNFDEIIELESEYDFNILLAKLIRCNMVWAHGLQDDYLIKKKQKEFEELQKLEKEKQDE